ncbi:hypothetical protein, partial [Peribacillus butanolivorans]|uniref:hypothetical protein n=1 Tax=Peribacillus butanolivorans TaxID=421767 RepID=UPI0035D8234C
LKYRGQHSEVTNIMISSSTRNFIISGKGAVQKGWPLFFNIPESLFFMQLTGALAEDRSCLKAAFYYAAIGAD